MKELPLVGGSGGCSLDAEALRARADEFRALFTDALRRVEPTPGGALLAFDPSERVRATLAGLVEAEAACCPTMHMRVTDSDPLTLLIASPADDDAVIALLVALAREVLDARA